ncbi:hypothetical protein [Rhodococcus ruber]|uniref:hypothetical protein n=1 Tax=Rhodococcus ruber TaxID=1830 RepID=UPI0037831E11
MTAPAPTLTSLTPSPEAHARVRSLGRWRIEHIAGTDRWAAWLRTPDGRIRFYTEAAGWASCSVHATRVHQALLTIELLKGNQ